MNKETAKKMGDMRLYGMQTTGGQSELSKVAYPPIDGILLRQFNKKHNMSLNTTWSKFGWDDYIEVIEAIKAKYSSPMWQVEALWNPHELVYQKK